MLEHRYRDAWVRRVSMTECRDWLVHEGRLQHRTGRYFQVIGAKDAGGCERLLLDQPEIGVLGMFFRERDGRREWLLQEKIEPGNVGGFQWAPTIQATRSNYERVHGGGATRFLDELLRAAYLVDVEQSEQGGQFVGKFNRNVKVHMVDEENLAAPDGFRWMSSGTLRELLLAPFSVNTDARSVLASGAWSLLAEPDRRAFEGGSLPREVARACARSLHVQEPETVSRALASMAEVSRLYEEKLTRVPIDAMRQLTWTSDGIYDRDGRLELAFFEAHLPTREVQHWCQPLLLREQQALHVLVLRITSGVARLCVVPYPELGFGSRVELGPTWQTGPGRWKRAAREIEAQLGEHAILADVENSDEGGRFFQQRGRYVLLHDESGRAKNDESPNIWLTLGDLEALSLRRGHVTNELRSLISVLLALQ